ncbi:hypothetical protein F5Y10DRAFT_262351 [Nemania abortiva]|nr:hypothetical protein F5Y10DRAFT_262351 [Nemania abortiva]
MVTSASEFWSVSLRWWNLAFPLAREAKLNRELPPGAGVDDETREERRRVWWFLFTMDRHISLCYNKPLFLHDSECQGTARRGGPGPSASACTSSASSRRYDRPWRDHRHAQGAAAHRGFVDWDGWRDEIVRHNAAYEPSLGKLKEEGRQNGASPPMATEIVCLRWAAAAGALAAEVGRAVVFADAADKLLGLDFGMSFMSFYSGVYLLQGGFLMLAIADHLQARADPTFVRASKTVVYTHEASIVRLPSQYQRAIVSALKSAISEMRGRVPDDGGNPSISRRKALDLYRWTTEGSCCLMIMRQCFQLSFSGLDFSRGLVRW